MVLLGCSFDTPAENKTFKDKHDFPFDLLSDESGEMSKAYGNPLRPNGMPERISVLVGPDGKVARRFEPVTPAEHPAEVMAAL